MPEGHTIHRLARDHEKWFVGQIVDVQSPQGRFADEAKKLSGKRLVSVEAHGKHLFYRIGRLWSLHIHLGLYGKFRMYTTPMPEPRGEVRVRLVGEKRGFDLNGPNQCELLTEEEVQNLRDRLGVDPLRTDSDPELLWQKLQRCRKPIGSVLLDQSIIAGIGNIYRAEILFILGINPNRFAKDVSRNQFDDLWKLTRQLLEIGVRYNRIITVEKGVTDQSLTRLNKEERLNFYKKDFCPKCAHPVVQAELAARKIYFCARCQIS